MTARVVFDSDAGRIVETIPGVRYVIESVSFDALGAKSFRFVESFDDCATQDVRIPAQLLLALLRNQKEAT